jgi:hypothetical protein
MDFEQARRQAEQTALGILEGVYSGPTSQVLEQRFLEAEHCWMFFRSRAIHLPPEHALRAMAYVFSKRSGKGRLVADFWDDEVKLCEYLKVMSDYFATHDE